MMQYSNVAHEDGPHKFVASFDIVKHAATATIRNAKTPRACVHSFGK